MRHSQCTSEPLLNVWQGKDGTVECAHCTCTATLSEVCLHVGAILFYVEVNRCLKTSIYCVPVEYTFKCQHYHIFKDICDINFVGPGKLLLILCISGVYLQMSTLSHFQGYVIPILSGHGAYRHTQPVCKVLISCI